jgi:hypothetical protein
MDEYNTPRNVLEDACVVCMIEYDPEDPRASLNKVINFHCMVHMDPAISSTARELYEKGRRDMLRELTDGDFNAADDPPALGSAE